MEGLEAKRRGLVEKIERTKARIVEAPDFDAALDVLAILEAAKEEHRLPLSGQRPKVWLSRPRALLPRSKLFTV